MAGDGVKVLIGVPHTGAVRSETMSAIARLVERSGAPASVSAVFRQAAPVDAARHLVVREFLSDRAATHLFFLDSDMGPPADAIERLLALNRPIACLPCPILAPARPGAPRGPEVTTNIWRHASPPETPNEDRIVRYLEPDEFPPEPFACDGTGLACCLVRREVFERIGPPYFAFEYSADGTQVRVGEDSFFFAKAAGAGFPITVDPGAFCEHYKEIDLTAWEDFFRDRPTDWPWRRGAGPAAGRVRIVAIARNGSLHGRLAAWLARAARNGCPAEVLGAAEYSPALLEAVRGFLRNRSEDYLLLVDSAVVPPDDFVDRALAAFSDHAAGLASGFFRERHEGGIASCALVRNGERWTSLEIDPAESPRSVSAASLRAAIVPRATLASLGTSWIEPGCSPREAGIALATALARRAANRPIVLPIACGHYQTIGLLDLLETKRRIRARLRGSTAGAEPRRVEQ